MKSKVKYILLISCLILSCGETSRIIEPERKVETDIFDGYPEHWQAPDIMIVKDTVVNGDSFVIIINPNRPTK